MPIKPENRGRYPANWPEIRARILERAFTGFAALAAPGRARHWREVLGVPPEMREMWQIRDAYRRRAMQLHPDRPGGSHDAMTELNAALAAAEQELTA